MCGIFGLLSADPERLPSSETLSEIVSDLGHRGPDAAGHGRSRHVALAHTRLALLDLGERANQPMWDATGRHALVYNGEIYNFAVLRSELEQEGCSFRTESDTEVLLQGLLKHGPALLPRLEGMFAFALHDSQANTLLLARDRLGIKPLVYAAGDGFFCFASEVRPLRHCLPLLPNRHLLAAYLTGHEPPTQGKTLFEGVRTLESGHFLEVDLTGAGEPRPFFTVPDFAQPALAREYRTVGVRALIERLDGLLQASVRKHMIADVEVGSLCSGGLDSSLITAVAAREHRDLVLFHADVVGRKSERDAAERLARHLKLELHCVAVDDDMFLSLIPETVLRYEAPFSYHPNSVPFLAVARLVQQHGIKAILSGEGADEAFLGYAHTRRRVLAQRFGKLLGSLLSGKSVGETRPELSGSELLLRLERTSEQAAIERMAGPEAADPTALELMGYHLRTLMHRNDRLGMASGIEARFPLLDHDLLTFAANVPPEYKVRMDLRRWLRTRNPVTVKWLLRRVAEAYLPAGLAYRRKRGFPTTALRRLRVAPEYFESSWIGAHLELSRRQVSLLEDRAPQTLLTRLMLCDVWGRLLIEHETLESVQARLLDRASVLPE